MFSLGDSAFSSLDSTPKWNINLPGFDNNKASLTYGQCILAGGNDNECASKGFQSGSGGNAQIVGTADSQSGSLWDRLKYWGLAGVGVVTGNPALATTGLKASAAANGLGSLTVSRIATGLTGLILIAGAMFMFGVASFTPIGKIVEAAKGVE